MDTLSLSDPAGTPVDATVRDASPGNLKYAPTLACPVTSFKRSEFMSTILLIVLVLLVVGALPTWPYSTGWGYYPSGGLGLVVLIVLILVLTGRV
jgi:hypothetical protein